MNRIYLNELFDTYKSLLTDKEQECFLDYYGEDLSLSEIAENKQVSRNAVHKTLKNVITKLEDYEQKLKLKAIKEELAQYITKGALQNNKE